MTVVVTIVRIIRQGCASLCFIAAMSVDLIDSALVLLMFARRVTGASVCTSMLILICIGLYKFVRQIPGLSAR